ncbi:TIGR04283 family arsenosugar biosynthesis glycosyltransferase [Psychroflexus aestuariivivens]|uniref:TIGR04283 family arsenosugar biosynthesis glycosyltransferase n=1 Tax=Psychroflexus aestuariivivens TaxID=1795040 RepID=UPI000FD817BF|nr:TIGR04283 family arsenosugar biosynthesis glycosyltransferase [Psychroflexus aestuariivivens]
MLISIIIPALNEENYITEVLAHSLKLQGDFEIIVVDGGSSDNTFEIAKGFKEVQVFRSPRGRASQMNYGAALAKGEILLFLHADTILPDNAYSSIVDLCQDKKVSGGSFRLIMNGSHLFFKIYKYLSHFSLEFFTYGDHAMFIKSKVFKKINGYKEISFMEDVEIQKRLRREGKFKKLKTYVITSNRRLKNNGVTKQLIVDLILVGLYKVGIHPDSLKRFYPDR